MNLNQYIQINNISSALTELEYKLELCNILNIKKNITQEKLDKIILKSLNIKLNKIKKYYIINNNIYKLIDFDKLSFERFIDLENIINNNDGNDNYIISNLDIIIAIYLKPLFSNKYNNIEKLSNNILNKMKIKDILSINSFFFQKGINFMKKIKIYSINQNQNLMEDGMMK